MPMLIQSEYWKAPDGFMEVDPSSVRIHPISKLGGVLQALPLPADDPSIIAAACRLRYLCNKNN